MSDNVNWVQFNRGTEICSVRLRPDKAGAIIVLYYSAGKFWNKTPMFVTINRGERPFLEAFNGLRPVLTKSLFETNKKKTVALASAGKSYL